MRSIQIQRILQQVNLFKAERHDLPYTHDKHCNNRRRKSRDIDVQDVREKKLTDEKVASMYGDLEKGKEFLNRCMKIIVYLGIGIMAFILVTFVLHLLLPDATWLWRTY